MRRTALDVVGVTSVSEGPENTRDIFKHLLDAIHLYDTLTSLEEETAAVLVFG